jgi:uncharacterized RDD family membrane protein YckC
MEERIKNTKIWRLLAFAFDIIFILLVAFTVHMLFGMIFKLDSEGFQSYMIYITLAIVLVYLLFGELILRNTLGKYLFGIEIVDAEKSERPSSRSFIKRGLLKIIWPIEGLILLFSRQKKRLGDFWSDSIVVNKETNSLKPFVRIIIGIAAIVVLYFCFSVSLGMAAKRTDFYKAGVDYLKYSNVAEITGLPSEVMQSRDTIDFAVPVSIENQKRYARVYLAKNDGKWSVYKTEFFNGHLGVSYGYSFSSEKK